MDFSVTFLKLIKTKGKLPDYVFCVFFKQGSYFASLSPFVTL